MTVLKQTVIDLVKAFVEAREPFTSLDVSNGVKTLLPEVRHREVAEVLRGIWREDELRPSGEGARWFCTGGQRVERTRIEVGALEPTAERQPCCGVVHHRRKGAWLYHPLGTDPGEVYPEARRHATAIPPLERPADFMCPTMQVTVRPEAFASSGPFCGCSVAKDDTRPCVRPSGHDGLCVARCSFRGLRNAQCIHREDHDGDHTVKTW